MLAACPHDDTQPEHLVEEAAAHSLGRGVRTDMHSVAGTAAATAADSQDNDHAVAAVVAADS